MGIYNMLLIKKICNKYGYDIYETRYNLYITKLDDNDNDNWWKPNIYCEVDDDKYTDNSYYIKRFAICFSGHGVRNSEEETKIIKYINNANCLVKNLNNYINKCNKNIIQLNKKEK